MQNNLHVHTSAHFEHFKSDKQIYCAVSVKIRWSIDYNLEIKYQNLLILLFEDKIDI